MVRVLQHTVKQLASAGSVTTDAISTTTGSSIIAIVTCFGNHIGTFSDSGSHTWTADIGSTGGTKGWAALFRCHNITGSGSHTFTITSSSSNDFFCITLWEVEGLESAAPNHTNAASTSGTSHSSGSITADANTDELMFGGGALSAAAESGVVDSVDFAWSRRVNNATASFEGVAAGVAFAASGETKSFNYSTGNTQFETALIAGYKIAPGGGAGGAWSAAYCG